MRQSLLWLLCLLPIVICSLVSPTLAFVPHRHYHHHLHCHSQCSTITLNKEYQHRQQQQRRLQADTSDQNAATTIRKQQEQRLPATVRNNNHKKFNNNNNNNSNNNSNNNKTTKSTAHFAPEFMRLNAEITNCETAQDVLTLLASRKGALTALAGGGAVNSVNFSTAMHRMSRAMASNTDDRKATLSNPKYALFLCALCEAFAGLDCTQPLSSMAQGRQPNLMSQKQTQASASSTFRSRELTNIIWALAKAKIVPPPSAIPVDLTEHIWDDLVATSFQLRTQVLQSVQQQSTDWIPTLALLAAKLMDAVSYTITQETSTSTEPSTPNPHPMTPPPRAQELANFLWGFATAKRSTAPVVTKLLQTFHDTITTTTLGATITTPKPQEFSNSIWAIATCQIYTPGYSQLIQHCADALDNDLNFVNSFKPQELSNTAWGLATILAHQRQQLSISQQNPPIADGDLTVLRILRHVARQLIVRANQFKSQELTNSLWALATLGFGVVETETAMKMTMNEYVFLKSNDMEGDKDLMTRAVDAAAKSALPRLETFREMELNNLAYALARLEKKDQPQLLEGIGKQFGHHWRQRFDGQDIGTTMWALATLEYFNADIFRTIASKVRLDQAPVYRPQELSNMVWAAATAGVVPKYLDAFDTLLVSKRPSFSTFQDDPITVMFAAAAKELMNRPGAFKTQEIKDTLWAFSKIGLRHPALFKSVAEHLVGAERIPVPEGQIHCGRGMKDFSPQGIGNLMWSYAKQAQLSEGSNPDINGRLAIYCTISVDVGETLIKRLANCAAEASLQYHDELSKFKTNDIANMVWAIATLGIRHGRFFDAVATQIVDRTHDFLSGRRSGSSTFQGQELTNTVWACASINVKNPKLLDAVSKYAMKQCTDKDGNFNAKTIARFLKRQELANLAWSCAVMGYYPKDLLRLCYRGLFGEGDERDPAYMTKVHGDDGLQSHAIMSLLYVQMAMDLDIPGKVSDDVLCLPGNFPVGWDMSGDYSLTSQDDMIPLLNLTTSGIQNKVSRTLKRIGFGHVEEYVIPTSEMVHEYGVRLVGTPVDVLSIDIADPVRKIGVEVDGPGHFIHVLDTWSPQEPALGFVQVVNGKVEYQFLWDDRMEVNGSTALKQRLMNKLGWNIKHLPFWEWHSLQGSHQKEEGYCESLLND